MLRTRILSSFMLVTLVVASALLPSFYMQWLMGVLLCLALYELAQLIGLSSRPATVLYAVGGCMLYLLMGFYGKNITQYPFLLLVGLTYTSLVVIYSLLNPELKLSGSVSNTVHKTLMLGIWGIFGLLMAVHVIIWLHVNHIDFLGLFMVMVATTDTGGYICGRLWGKKKLAPTISPGKTWAGLYGGVGMAWIASLMYFVVFIDAAIIRASDNSLIWLSITVFILAPVSIMGDLFESLLKRRQGLKDSGMIIPGHGGIMDRIDGYILAAPLYVLLLSFYFTT